jgi:hypothetical protein
MAGARVQMVFKNSSGSEEFCFSISKASSDKLQLMKKPLHIIHEKIGTIRLGLLRYWHDDKKITLHGSIHADSNEILHCIISDPAPAESLLDKDISLVQKDKDNYLYVDGRISQVIKGKKITYYIKVKKACWFVRKRKGSVTSLQEKCIYENFPFVKLAS